MATQINWGIIGCGDVTEVKSGPAFNKVPGSKLVAVMRRDREKAADYARRHNVPRWYDNAGQLINDPEVNAVYIATPPSSHEECTLAALKAGKPVYVEKPMSLSAASCATMAEAAHQHKTKLSVAHYRRQLPLFKKVHALLQDKAVGQVRLIIIRMQQSPSKNVNAKTAVNWRVDPALSGGGLFHDLAPHQLDLMYYYFGPALQVNGFSESSSALYQADDLVTGLIKFKDGPVLSGTWCFSVQEDDVMDVCEIIGSEGTMSFSFFGGTTIQVSTPGGKQVYTELYPAHVQQPMIEQVVQYFAGTAPNPCPAEEAMETMRWMDTMTKQSS